MGAWVIRVSVIWCWVGGYGFWIAVVGACLVIVVIIVVAAAALLITYLPRVLINHGPTVEVSGVTYQGVINRHWLA
ncbi:hypothetical protein [Vulcanisaeta sp. JCM 14467]|uniref:hypothetical protein n=1 Tax=Vulcanisaeta sp. JCM 14467 TaxID=1295370 RepID=UPI0006D01AD6|nr:hypothetical protein [Vulcanisaeta sp. JCM 14467]